MGWLDKYNDGGPVQENYNEFSMSAPEGFVGSGTFNKGRDYSPAWGGQFADGGELTTSNLPTYYGPKVFENCVGAGCSKIATTEAANLFGLPYDQLAPQDAWYKRAAILKNKGKEIWTPKSKDYSNVKVGDFISLDRPGNERKDDASSTPGYRLSDNEGNEHEGVIIGKDENGIPLVKHGSEHGKVHVQPITDLFLDDAGPTTLNYKPLSIYRAASTENRDIKSKKYYTKPEKAIDTNWSNPVRKPTENEKKYINAINKNAPLQQQVYELTAEEAKRLNNISYGIFHNESEAGKSSTPVGGKMILSALAHAFGRDASPSLGDVQVKYDDLAFNADKSLSTTGRMMRDVGVNRDGLYSPMAHREDYNDEVNAVSAALATTFNKIKKNPEKYKYNPKTNTVYGDIPVDQALATIYRFGPSAFKESMLRDKESYGKNAIQHMKDIDGSASKKPIGTHKGQPLYIKNPEGKYAMGGPLKKFLQPTDSNLRIGWNPEAKGFSTEYSTTIGGPGEVYLVPGFKYGQLSKDPESEFINTGEHLGGPFKSVQSAEDFAELRHKFVEKGQKLPSPYKTKDYAMGGGIPGAVGFTYARTGSIPSNGPYAKKTKASAENGKEMKFYQEGLDFKPKTISKDGSQLVKLDQLTNFSNYNTKQPGGWLDRYDY